MKFTITRQDGVELTKNVQWDDKVQIAQLEKDGWKKAEEKAAPKKPKKKGTK